MLIRIQHLGLARVLSKVLSSVLHLMPTRKLWRRMLLMSVIYGWKLRHISKQLPRCDKVLSLFLFAFITVALRHWKEQDFGLSSSPGSTDSLALCPKLFSLRDKNSLQFIWWL